MLAAALWLPHEWDWGAFQWLSSRVQPAFSQDVKIVDIAWSDDVPTNRKRVAAFLDGLVASKHRVNAVILDVEFDPCQSKPCGEPMESARESLIGSIRRAAAQFPVYAIEEPNVNREDEESGPLDPQIRRSTARPAARRKRASRRSRAREACFTGFAMPTCPSSMRAANRRERKTFGRWSCAFWRRRASSLAPRNAIRATSPFALAPRSRPARRSSTTSPIRVGFRATPSSTTRRSLSSERSNATVRLRPIAADPNFSAGH